jgi:hypothetical protein
VVDDANEGSDSPLPLVAGRWPDFYRGVAAALRDDAPDPVMIDDVIANLRVLDAAREAGTTGATVTLDPPAAHRA